MAKLSGELGPLERAVMEFVWNADPREVTVRDVMESRVGKGHAYTTVMTILDRLWHKGYLFRRRVGRAYAYRTGITRDQHVQRLITKVLEGASDRQSALLGFVRSVDQEDLDALRRAIRERERERRKG